MQVHSKSRRRAVCAFALGGVVILLSPTASAGTKPPKHAGRNATASSSCKVKVYVSDPDPSGLNVRATPSSKAKIVGTLPTKGVEAVMLLVDRAEAGWLHFTGTEVAGSSATPIPEEGWVSGRLVRVDIAPHIVGPLPSNIEYPLATLEGSKKELRMEEENRVEGVMSCDGTSVLVLIRPKKGKAYRAWLKEHSYCGNPLTVCS